MYMLMKTVNEGVFFFIFESRSKKRYGMIVLKYF